MLVLDESDAKFHRDVIIPKAALTMFGEDYCNKLVEPPFQVASHLYQTLQCADWICGLLGRLGAYEAEPQEFAEFEWARTFFKERLMRESWGSSIRSKEQALQLRARWVPGVNVRPSALSVALNRVTEDPTGVGPSKLSNEVTGMQ